MPTVNLPAVRACRPAWIEGRIIAQKRPLTPKHVWAIRVRLEIAGRIRNLALFNLTTGSKLRGCDLLRLKVADIYAAGQVEERTSITLGMTCQRVRFKITEATRKSLETWPDDPLMGTSDHFWPDVFTKGPHLDAAIRLLVPGRVAAIGLEPSLYGTHSMRRTELPASTA